MKKRRQIMYKDSPELHVYRKCNKMLSVDTSELYNFFDEIVTLLTNSIEPKIKVILFDETDF